jgi:hypothetical protein
MTNSKLNKLDATRELLVDYPFAIPFVHPMRHLTPKMHTEGERKCEKMQNAEAVL